MCEREKERERAREIERESVCVCVCGREREDLLGLGAQAVERGEGRRLAPHLCFQPDRERESERVCVRESERVRERESE